MRGIEELDHYELLEVRRGASAGEIDRAYRNAQEIWAEGSLALYSVFDKRDASTVRARLDEAYRVLADPELRASYDRAQGLPGDEATAEAVDVRSGGGIDPLGEGIARDSAPTLGGPGGGHGAGAASDDPIFEESAPRFEGGEDDLAGEFDGSRLRRTRLFRGYEIDQIADVTKVSGTHLRNIEEENFADLPAEVYVRGFVTAYAKTIGLDPQIVVPSYMARLRDSKQKNQRSRFLGLR
ncbi:MAG: helix-turn-helix domain-containing protein [Myxococcota bacterium]